MECADKGGEVDMQCQICHAKEAVVHVKQFYEGTVKEIHVCHECAAQHGIDVEPPVSLTDFLFGIDVEQKVQPHVGGEDKECAVCHMRGSDLKKTSRLGCPSCYETFSDELMPLLAAIQKGDRHVGKFPAREGVAAEVSLLRKSLQEAVASENFEEAARLRDLLRDLEGEQDAGAKKQGVS